MASPDDITDLPQRLRRSSLRWSATGFAMLFSVGVVLGVQPLVSGEDPGAFFAPLGVCLASSWAVFDASRGRFDRGRFVFTSVLVVYVTLTMLLAPSGIRLAVGFPMACLILLLVHLLHPPPRAAQIGAVITASMAVGFIAMFIFDPPTMGMRISISASVAQVMVLMFANFVIDRMARGWTRALGAVLHAREAQARASQAKSTFLASMSHELRTPLNAVIGYAELAGEQLEDEGTADREDLQRIQQAGRHLLSLVNQVLDLSRIEAGKMELQLVEVDFARLIEDVCDGFGAALQHADDELVLNLDPIGPMALDPLRARQIVTNLMSNAVKFTQHGRIELHLEALPDAVRLHVRDTGPGIPRERLEVIFEAFEQASPSIQTTHGGTGLGLAISRQLAQQMGGDLRAENPPDGGAWFILSFDRPKASGRGSTEGSEAA